ncbi:uncharacterized protein LOC132316434 [Cornus florida]|uniref:uncharacterized protein LOC132316434 n=1 Tax=Cornus florida TaxID=4283 RepID=UPI0028A12670|nr:uncharacterized protein LOC132316434 [Cornus florida]XP_059670892.1 uncharacterized protein LOC132316434 [Cornus florida]
MWCGEGCEIPKPKKFIEGCAIPKPVKFLIPKSENFVWQEWTEEGCEIPKPEKCIEGCAIPNPEKFVEEGCAIPKPEKFLTPKPEKFLTPKSKKFVWEECTVGSQTFEEVKLSEQLKHQNKENKKRTWEEIVRQEGFAGSRTVEAYNEKVKLFEEFGRRFEEERKEWEKTRSRLFEEFKEDVKEWQKAYLSCGYARPKCMVGSQTFEEVKRSEQLKHQNKENKKKTWEEIVRQEGPAGSQTVEAYNEKVKLFEEFSHQNKENFKKWEQRYSRDGVEVPEKFAWQECTEEGCFNPKPEKFLIPKPEKFPTPKPEEFVWQECTVGRATCEDCIEKVKCVNHQVEQLEQELEIVNRRKKRCLRDEVEVPEKLSRLAAGDGIRNIIPTEHKRVK